jgi:hypothetical protein
VVLEPPYVERHLEHAYAATITLTEGLTYDYAHALAGDALAKEAAYVVLTRNRIACRLHDWLDHEHDAPVPISTERQALSDRLQRARSEHLAIDDDPVTLEREAATLRERADVWRQALAVLGRDEPIPDPWRAPLERVFHDLSMRTAPTHVRERTFVGDLTTRLRSAPTEPDQGSMMRRLLERARNGVGRSPTSAAALRSHLALDEALSLARSAELTQQGAALSFDRHEPGLAPTKNDHGIDMGIGR